MLDESRRPHVGKQRVKAAANPQIRGLRPNLDHPLALEKIDERPLRPVVGEKTHRLGRVDPVPHPLELGDWCQDCCQAVTLSLSRISRGLFTHKLRSHQRQNSPMNVLGSGRYLRPQTAHFLRFPDNQVKPTSRR